METARILAEHIFTPSPIIYTLRSHEKISDVSFYLTGSKKHKNLLDIVSECVRIHPDAKSKMELAASLGLLDWVVKFADEVGDSYQLGRSLDNAVKNGHLEIVKFLFSRAKCFGPNTLNYAKGNFEIAKFFMSIMKRRAHLTWRFRWAVKHEDTDLTQEMLSLNPRESIVVKGLITSARKGNMFIVRIILQHMMERGFNDTCLAEVYVARHGCLQTLKMLWELDSEPFCVTIIDAVKYGHIHIVEFLVGQGLTDYDHYMIIAGKYGHDNIVELMLSLGATSYGDTLDNAALNGHIKIVKMMLKYTIVSEVPNDMMKKIVQRGYRDVAIILTQCQKIYNKHIEEAKIQIHQGVLDFLELW